MTRNLRVPLALVTVSLIVAVAVTILFLQMGAGGAAEAARSASTDPAVAQWPMISAAVAAGLSTLAAGYAVGAVGSAAVGALAEKPELLGRMLILVGMAEGIAIYGLIVAVLILNRAG